MAVKAQMLDRRISTDHTCQVATTWTFVGPAVKLEPDAWRDSGLHCGNESSSAFKNLTSSTTRKTQAGVVQHGLFCDKRLTWMQHCSDQAN